MNENMNMNIILIKNMLFKDASNSLFLYLPLQSVFITFWLRWCVC